MWRDYTNLGKWGIVRLILLVIFIILVILGAKYSKAECITIYDNTKEIVAENAYNPAKDEVEFFRHGKILMDSEIFAEPNSSCIEFFGNVHKHATEIFIREINGFFELSSGGFVKKEAVTFDFDEESQIFPNKYNLSDMRVNNMINLPIQYLGSLSQKTAGDGVTNKSKLFFVGDIPIYEFIDGYAYFPSGRNIYKISLEHFSDIKNVGESYEVLAAYRTVYYTGSSYNRRYNIALVASILDGTIIPPEKTFSYNKITGPRDASAGYLPAPVIQNGDYAIDYGGGVCQVSSTIYAAILNQEKFRVTARKPHGSEVSYLPVDMDATVSYGGVDFKFINKYPFSVKLNVKTKDDAICLVTITRVK